MSKEGSSVYFFTICPAIYRFTDDFSIGNITEFTIGGWGNNYGLYFYAAVPTYITLRYGTNASRETGKKLGIAAGIGYRFNYNYLSVEIALYGGTFPNYSASYFLPAWMVEVVHHERHCGSTALRVNGGISSYYDKKGELERNDEY